MNLENIQEMWKRDSVIDSDLYCEESTRIPQLHQKYMELFNTFFLMQKEQEAKLKTTKRDKWLYYKGRAPASVYKDAPFDLKLTTREEIDMFIEADEEYQKVILKLDYIGQVLAFLDSVLRQLNNRTFQIKNAIEWQKFQNGL
jgi:hypothetical protein